MNEADFCQVFCGDLALREVPIGYVLKTPFQREDGDSIAIYIRCAEDGTCRIEDDGQTIGYLDANGFDLDGETRFSALSEMLREHNAFFNESECLLHTAYIPQSKAPDAALLFCALLIRVYDLLLLAPSRVRSTFRDDLIEMVRRQFGGQASIDLNAAYRSSMKDYLVDIIVRAPDGKALAIFAGTSELKALEALLFWKEYRDQHIDKLRAMLVVETVRARDIKERTLSRIVNSDILLATMDGDEIQIGRKMRESVLA